MLLIRQGGIITIKNCISNMQLEAVIKHGGFQAGKKNV